VDESRLIQQFRAYMHASERLMTTHSILDKLDVVAHGVVESGIFQRCVVRVYRRRFSSRRVIGAAGLTAAERRTMLLGEEAPPEYYLALTHGARHLGRDCYYVRAGTAQAPPPGAGYTTVPSHRRPEEFEDWQPEDSFLAHLYSSRRVLLGHLVADDPADGRVPDDDSSRSFVLFASLAASLLEQELRLRTDPMTDAFNGFALDRELERLGMASTPFVAAFADMDGLKDVNDRLGHLWGDQYIRSAHEILLRQLPDDGLIYRPYGDEFVYLREGDDVAPVADAVAAIPEAVRRFNAEVLPRLVAASPEARAAVVPPLEMSVGLSYGARPDATEIVRQAEAAMYRAKSARGRGRPQRF
jgi:diguanylate cyclase (GGDEF)-like protein